MAPTRYITDEISEASLFLGKTNCIHPAQMSTLMFPALLNYHLKESCRFSASKRYVKPLQFFLMYDCNVPNML